MTEHLAFIQKLTEEELCELIIFPLLESLGYSEIRYIHGNIELGKDIVCKKIDPIEGNQYIGFVVKSKHLTGSVSSNRSIREIHYQIKQAYSAPFIDPLNGDKIKLNKIYFITPYIISQNSILSISDELSQTKDNVFFIDGIKLLNLVNVNLPDLIVSLPNPDQRYIRILYSKFSQNLAISKLGSDKSYSLNDIYIPAKLTEITQYEAKFITLGKPLLEDGNLLSEIFQLNKYLVILADAGSGKSTLMHDLIVQLSSTYKSLNQGSIIPLFIELSKVPIEKITNFLEFQIWIEDTINVSFAYNNFHWKDSSRFVLLLDGFDELKSCHEKFIEYIESLTNFFPNGLIITSRPTRIPELKGDFTYYKLNPFSNFDIMEFLNRWFGKNEEKKNEVYNYIINDNVLLNFCRTPLIMTLFTILSTREPISKLPKRRTEIYSKIVELLIDDWDSVREIKSEFSPATKHFFLEKLAFNIHYNGNKFFTIKEIENIEHNYTKWDKGEVFRLLDELIYRSSLIRKNDSINYSFVHLSFQEYFTAKHLHRFHNDFFILRVLYNEWWINALKFYFGIIKTMDSIRIFQKRSMESSHILIEYLNESVFTSSEKIDEILRPFGNQLINSGLISKNSLQVFIENQAIIIPHMEKYIKERSIPRYNYSFMALMKNLGAQGIIYIDFDKYPIDLIHYSEMQSFLIEHIQESISGISVYKKYLDSFDKIEKRTDAILTKETWDELFKNIEIQQGKVSSLNIEKKSKEELIRRINNHRENMKKYRKRNAM